MSGFSTQTDEHLIRSNLWSTELKEMLLEDLMMMQYVRMIDQFPDGQTLNIPSIGQMEAQDYVEGNAIKYTAMDTGNFQFSIDEYKSAATFITNKEKQDSFYFSQLVASFVPKMHRAIAKSMEINIMEKINAGQTATSLNTINGGDHRFVASGSNQVLQPKDFARAKYALQKANVPMVNLVAIVDPSVEFALSTLSNIVQVANNPKWEGIVRDGMSTGMRFSMNVFGFDVYVCQNLPQITAGEEIDSVSVNSSGVGNLFFSAASDVVPVVGQVRQPPTVESSYEKDLQREEYVTTARWGFKLYRPENMVMVLSATDQVA
jgi:HK97 family phage major capsid protein